MINANENNSTTAPKRQNSAVPVEPPARLRKHARSRPTVSTQPDVCPNDWLKLAHTAGAQPVQF